MSRYIDADALKKTFELLVADENDRKFINGVIEMFPTAYDVEAVCEKLGEMQIIANTYNEKVYIMAIEKAIEIVKGGGTDDVHR